MLNFFFQAEDGIRDRLVTGVQTCALPISKDFHVNAWTDNGTIMGIQHETLPLVGLQFHPESISTEKGMELLESYLKI